jgi:metal-sulfur cluster biosynthetic enzyme
MIAARAEAMGASAVPGTGSPDRRAAVLAAIGTIVDPCSRALGRPVGLVGMGMIAGLDEECGCVRVTVLPTFPTCMFRGVLEEEIEAIVRAMPWCTAVSVRFADAEYVWDETRLSEVARTALGRRPAGARSRVA